VNQTAMTEALDEAGVLDVARGPGCYALSVAVPDKADLVARHWHRVHDAGPPEGVYAQLAQAQDVYYVGASGDVYGRLCDHCGDTRKAAFLDAFPPDAVAEVWPHDDATAAFEAEYNHAVALRDGRTRVWTDGELV